MKIGPVHSRIAALVFSPSAVCASSQIDDRVGARDLARVAHEPLVGLDRHRAVDRVLALQQRAADALGVAAVAQLAEELVDEVAPVGEDQHAARVRGLHEAERGDRLACAGRVLEPEALGRVRVLGLLGERLLLALLVDPVAGLLLRVAVKLLLGLLLLDVVVLLLELVLLEVVLLVILLGRRSLHRAEILVVLILILVLEVVLLLVLILGRLTISLGHPAGATVGGTVPGGGGDVIGTEDVGGGQQLGGGGRRRAAVGAGGGALGLRQQSGERSRQRVDLVRGEDGAVHERRLLLGEQPLQAEQQRELPPPRRRRVLELGVLVQLRERRLERAPARRSRRQRDQRILALVDETLAHELLRALDVGGTWNGRGREGH